MKMLTPALRVEDLSVMGPRHFVSNVSFAVQKSKIVALFGPSGAGKSTTLLSICGLLAPTLRVTGKVWLGDREITTSPPEDRSRLGLSIVLQGLALFPQMTVADNVAYPLRRRGVPRAEARHIVDEQLSSFRLTGLGDRRPAALSGGEQQRVAIARAMVSSPSVLLLDEPFKGLDQRLRDELLALVLQVAEAGTAILLVTHERREIELTADVVLSMRDGKTDFAPEERCTDIRTVPFRAIEGHVLLPPVDSFHGGWVPAAEVHVVGDGQPAEPSVTRVTAHLIAIRNIGDGKVALLCRYATGTLGWLESDGMCHDTWTIGSAISVEYRPQNGVGL